MSRKTHGNPRPLIYPFVWDELESAFSAQRLRMKPMFGCQGIYVDEKIVFFFRLKEDENTARDNGIWVATQPEHSHSIGRQFPVLRPIELFPDRGRTGFTGWLNLPADDDTFESTALELCRLIASGDPRLGKIPKPRKKLDYSHKK